jgi:hypothetical protein
VSPWLSFSARAAVSEKALMVTAGPPPLTILQPGEGLTAPERGDLGMIGVAFKLWGCGCRAPFPKGPEWSRRFQLDQVPSGKASLPRVVEENPGPAAGQR